MRDAEMFATLCQVFGVFQIFPTLLQKVRSWRHGNTAHFAQFWYLPTTSEPAAVGDVVGDGMFRLLCPLA